MAREITERKPRTRSGEIIRALDRGERFVVTRNGVAVGELAPMQRRQFVTAEVAIDAFAGAPEVDLARLRTDLDAIVEQNPRPGRD